jgi:hypothetical protein
MGCVNEYSNGSRASVINASEVRVTAMRSAVTTWAPNTYCSSGPPHRNVIFQSFGTQSIMLARALHRIVLPFERDELLVSDASSLQL